MSRINAIPEERVEFIKAHSDTHTIAEVAELLGLSVGAVSNTARTRGIKFTKNVKKSDVYRRMALTLHEAGYSVTDIYNMNFKEITYQALYKWILANQDAPTLH